MLMFGTYDLIQVTISKDDTVILDGAGDKKGIEERCEQVCTATCSMQIGSSHCCA